MNQNSTQGFKHHFAFTFGSCICCSGKSSLEQRRSIPHKAFSLLMDEGASYKAMPLVMLV